MSSTVRRVARLALVASVAVLGVCLAAVSHSTIASVLACVAAIATLASIGSFAAALNPGGRLDAAAAATREWVFPRFAPFVGALAGAPFDPTARGIAPALVPERYEQIANAPRWDGGGGNGSWGAHRFRSRRIPVTQRYGTRLLWSVLFVVYAYLALFALVVLLSIFGN